MALTDLSCVSGVPLACTGGCDEVVTRELKSLKLNFNDSSFLVASS